jgi:opacity protein-like surface antigen
MSTTRVGYTFGNVLGYVKGGTALGLVTLATDDNVPGDWLSRSHHWYSGWVLGAGVEYEIVPNLLFGIEYNYVTIDGKAATRIVDEAGGLIGSFRSRVDLDTHSIVARLNYKIDAPVLATLLPF